MVNLDSLGTNPTKVELDRGDKLLASALLTVASSMHLPLSAVNVHQVGRSDSDSFSGSPCSHSDDPFAHQRNVADTA